MEPECTPGICPAGSIHDSVTKFFKSEWNGAPFPPPKYPHCPRFSGFLFGNSREERSARRCREWQQCLSRLVKQPGKLSQAWNQVNIFIQEGRVIFIVIVVKLIVNLGKIIYTDDQMINIYIQHQSFLVDNVLKWPLYGWRWWLLFLT